MKINELEYALELLLRGVEEQQVLELVGLEQMPEEVEGLLQTPLAAVAGELAYQLSKSRSLVSTLTRLPVFRQNRDDGVTEVSSLKELAEAQDKNQPCVMRGLVEQVAPHIGTLLGFDALRNLDIETVVASRFRSNAYAGQVHERQQVRVPFRRLIENLLSGKSTTAYITALDRLLYTKEFASIYQALQADPNWENLIDWGEPRLWIGGPKSFTPLHHDDSDSLLVQVEGTKVVTLYPPEAEGVTHVEFCFGDIAIQSCDLGGPFDHVEVRPGDAILIPVGWWHAVAGLDATVTMVLVPSDKEKGWHQPFHWRAAVGSGVPTAAGSLAKPRDHELPQPYIRG